jgi:transcriptional regulator with XRE-family HTH domain
VPTEEKELLKQFGKKLAEIRKKKNLSQEELAWNAGIGDNQIGRIERGEHSPSLNTVFKIANALSVSARDLF